MTKHSLSRPLRSLLLTMLCFSSCNAQDKTRQKQAGVNKQKTATTGQPKIKKPTGIHQDDNIHSALQDKAGNIWFCTSGEGVYRYDGKLFTNFTRKDGLNCDTVFSMLEDKAGNLWFGTDAGLCLYNGKTFAPVPIIVTDNSHFLPYTSDNSSAVECSIWSIMQDKAGGIWIGTRDSGIYRYDPSAALRTGSKTFTHFLHNDAVINKDNLHPRWVSCIFEDKKGNIWFTSGPLSPDGAYRYDHASGVITAFNPNGDKWVRSILEDKNGDVLFVTRHKGVCLYNPSAAPGSTEAFTNITANGGPGDWCVTSIFEDKTGNLWFGEDKGNNKGEYDGGLWRLDRSAVPRGSNPLPAAQAGFTKFTTKDGLSNNGVWCIMQDRAGNVWAASRCNGVSRYNSSTTPRVGSKTITSFTE